MRWKGTDFAFLACEFQLEHQDLEMGLIKTSDEAADIKTGKKSFKQISKHKTRTVLKQRHTISMVEPTWF